MALFAVAVPAAGTASAAVVGTAPSLHGTSSKFVTPTSTSAISAGGAYTALTPTRILDTRASNQTLGAGGSLQLTVTGAAGVPVDASAVAVVFTATDTTASSYLSAYPSGSARPVVSNLNWVSGQTVANLAIVPVGSNGQITLFNYAGSADVVVDLQGYFSPELSGSTSGSYVPLTPARIADTRPQSGLPDAGRTLGAGAQLAVQVTGVGGVPSSGASAALLNVTATDTSASSFLTAWPAGGTRPLASDLNWTAGATVADRVLVPVGPTGAIDLYNLTGQADVVVDVAGYVTDGATAPAGATLFTAISPVRVLDTRTGLGPVGSQATIAQQLGGIDGVASDATAVVATVTATGGTQPGFLTVYPGGTRPTASDVNWQVGQTVANLAIMSLSTAGQTKVFNSAGSTEVIIDASGYFAPAPVPTTVPTPTTTTTTTSTSTTPSLSPLVPTAATQEQSTNWSGYVATSGPYTAATGTFVIPSLSNPAAGSDTAEWVGIDGFNNQALIQAGINESPDPSSPGGVQIYAWWEVLPAAATPIAMTVAPGDRMTVTIDQSGAAGGQWSIDIVDDTTGQTFSTTLSYTGQGTSAEWIVEAPQINNAQSVLASYTPTSFSNLEVHGSQSGLTELQMAAGGQLVSVPSAIDSAGFAVTYGSSTPAAP